MPPTPDHPHSLRVAPLPVDATAGAAKPGPRLEIELDQRRIASQVAVIAESDFFRRLERAAGDLRAALRAA